MQAKYNRSKPYLITTLQNYLKIAPQRVDFELEITKRKGLCVAMKLVRGAYLVEESKVSKESGTESPIVDSF
jgi:proline dehydrogenase